MSGVDWTVLVMDYWAGAAFMAACVGFIDEDATWEASTAIALLWPVTMPAMVGAFVRGLLS